MSSDILSLPPVPADARTPYGADPNQFLDLYLPKSSGPHPVLMNIHGGYWRARYDLTHASRFCRAFADHGIAALNLEYRRIGNFPAHQAAWPGALEDVLAAWSTLPRLARDHSLDLSRTLVTGHSAGAQLALAFAHRLNHPKSAQTPLRAALSLAGLLDLQRAFDLHLSNDAVVEFLGGSPNQVPEHYAEADPIRLSISLPQVLFHGVPDDSVPIELSRLYFAAKSHAREPVHYHESPTADHFEWIDPRTPEWQQILSAAQSFLK